MKQSQPSFSLPFFSPKNTHSLSFAPIMNINFTLPAYDGEIKEARFPIQDQPWYNLLSSFQ